MSTVRATVSGGGGKKNGQFFNARPRQSPKKGDRRGNKEGPMTQNWRAEQELKGTSEEALLANSWKEEEEVSVDATRAKKNERGKGGN